MYTICDQVSPTIKYSHYLKIPFTFFVFSHNRKSHPSMSVTNETVIAGGFKVTKHGLRENGEGLFAAKYSPDGKFLAATLGSGALRVFRGDDSCALLQKSKLGQGFDDVPSTCVRFRPECEFSEENMYELITCSTAGGLFGFNIDNTEQTEDIFLDRTWKAPEEHNETNCADFTPDGLRIATVGSDRSVRIYDPNTRKLLDTLSKGRDENGHTRPAHTNRIFCAKFANPTTLITGGWENPVQIWDLRTGKSERQLGGPNVSGDTIDLLPGGQQIIVGSARPERQIQVFDFLSCREVVEDSERLSKPLDRSPVSCVRYSKEAGAVWCATTKPDQIMCIDFSSGSLKGKVDAPSLVFNMDVHPTNKNRCVAVGMKELMWTLETSV